MAKSKTSRPLAPASPKAVTWKRRQLPHVVGAVLVVALLCTAYHYSRGVVEHEYTMAPVAPRISLVNRPAWMSDALAKQIIDLARPVGLHSAFDQHLLEATAQSLQTSPWIAKVSQVRRVYDQRPADTVAVECVYRAPTAMVRWDDYYWLVDSHGYKLPEQYTRDQARKAMIGPDGKLVLRVIEGVMHAPVASGTLWPGDDLAAGLDLIRTITDQPWAQQLPVIDVSNFSGRRDQAAAHLVIWTNSNSSIRWGRAPTASDYFVEVSTQRKLQVLAEIFDQTHRVDGGKTWLDVRFDRVTYPTPVPPGPQAQISEP